MNLGTKIILWVNMEQDPFVVLKTTISALFPKLNKVSANIQTFKKLKAMFVAIIN